MKPSRGPITNVWLICGIPQIIGAPSFFPTVWGWIKRWFDPVTVNKIFILSHHEVKARLSEFIDPDDFPKKYGGNLNWDVGMSPHLDQAATEAVERNGSKGWIEGPCLWEKGQRVPVGSVGGKPRRPARVEPIPAPVPIDSRIVTQPPPAVEPAAPVPAAVLSPLPAPPPPQSEPAESISPPSMAPSGSTASTFVGNALETTTAAPVANGTTKLLESEAPIVANGEVLHAGAGKPPVERFVTAFEDLHTTRAQVDVVVA